jgi:cell division protein FtsL
MAEQHHHEPGKMDITEQEKTFDLFMKVLVINVVVIAIVLIFLALVNA